METDKRLFLEDILARTERIMEQCAELKALVSSCLEGEDAPAVATDLPPADEPEMDTDLPPADEPLVASALEGGEDLPDDFPAEPPVASSVEVTVDAPSGLSAESPSCIPTALSEDNQKVIDSENVPIAVDSEDVPKAVDSADIPEAIDIEDSIIPIFEKALNHKAVVDKLAATQAWRTDLPGSKVSDIRSAISLNDRILFINHLFGEDPAAFKDALTTINSMEGFEQAVTYLTSSHPEWNMESDTVYRFMMAVRRRLQ